MLLEANVGNMFIALLYYKVILFNYNTHLLLCKWRYINC
jgi:hypothetical protein